MDAYDPSLQNTHPFRRALGGRVHIFAHNGSLKGLHDDYADTDLNYQPTLTFYPTIRGLRFIFVQILSGVDIIGETILSARAVFIATVAAILGSILYRIVIAFALNLDAINLKGERPVSPT